jgi:hypothetical protein
MSAVTDAGLRFLRDAEAAGGAVDCEREVGALAALLAAGATLGSPRATCAKPAPRSPDSPLPPLC